MCQTSKRVSVNPTCRGRGSNVAGVFEYMITQISWEPLGNPDNLISILKLRRRGWGSALNVGLTLTVHYSDFDSLLSVARRDRWHHKIKFNECIEAYDGQIGSHPLVKVSISSLFVAKNVTIKNENLHQLVNAEVFQNASKMTRGWREDSAVDTGESTAVF